MNQVELFSFRNLRWFENIGVVSVLAAIVATGFIALALTSGSTDSVSANVGLIGAMLAVSAGTVGGGISASRYQERRKEAVFARLSPLSTSNLVALSGSPEVGEQDRKMVIEFLNTHRAGWSFSVPTTNTTSR